MKIHVHIREQIFKVNCGQGRAKLQWLGDIAVHRYDSCYGLDTGVCKGIQTSDKRLLDLNWLIADTLSDQDHIRVLLFEDQVESRRQEHPMTQTTPRRQTKNTNLRMTK